MELNRIFKQPVSRPIEGVIKADDESSLYVELNEYVLTDEVAKRLEHFLDAYNDYHGANGVWVSSFFGSGKSHLLKMLALIMENRSVDGSTALDIFLPKIPKEDELLRAALKKAVAIPFEEHSVQHRPEGRHHQQEPDGRPALGVREGLQRDVRPLRQAGLHRSLRTRSRQPEPARGLQGQLPAARQQALGARPRTGLAGVRQHRRAYAEITGEDSALAKGILDKYRAQYSVSIEDFSEQVKAWLDKKPANFRLNFFVDEVGQYIADNTKLMTNLQTVAESLATKCQGRAWIIVTAQEDMNSVLGDMNKQQSNDSQRSKLASPTASSSPALTWPRSSRSACSPRTKPVLRCWPPRTSSSSTTSRRCSNSLTEVSSTRTSAMRSTSPTATPSFPTSSLCSRRPFRVSQHNGFEGKANSVGERSMLGVFRDVAIAIDNEPVGQLATFDRMFEGIRGALKAPFKAPSTTPNATWATNTPCACSRRSSWSSTSGVQGHAAQPERVDAGALWR